MRKGIAQLPDPEPFSGEVEIDESYFGKKKTGQGRPGTVQGQVAVFGLRERKSGLVIAEVVSGTSARELMPLIEKHVRKGSTIYSDGHGAYYHLSKQGYRHHVVYHDHTFVDQKVIHTNSIESFWAYAKHTLRPLKGLPYEAYPEHIKMVQKRYNTSENKKLRKLLRRILVNGE
jgi:transposase